MASPSPPPSPPPPPPSLPTSSLPRPLLHTRAATTRARESIPSLSLPHPPFPLYPSLMVGSTRLPCTPPQKVPPHRPWPPPSRTPPIRLIPSAADAPTPPNVPSLFISCERIRTFDPLHPMQVRYQAAPHTEAGNYSRARSGKFSNWRTRVREFPIARGAPCAVGPMSAIRPQLRVRFR